MIFNNLLCYYKGLSKQYCSIRSLGFFNVKYHFDILPVAKVPNFMEKDFLMR